MHGTVMLMNKALLVVWFNSGAVTDRGVGIGSSFQKLRRTYGSSLRYSSWGSHYYVLSETLTPKHIVSFCLTRRTRTINWIGFGSRQALQGWGCPPSFVWG
jgi:hypothetical protein